MLIGGASKRPEGIDGLIEPRVLARLERLDVTSRKMFPGKLQGERRSKRRGRSVEFDDYRTYAPGDDLRFIDWNVYARLDRLFVKLFLEEEDLALHVALDASASMDGGGEEGDGGVPDKLLFSARLAALLCAVGLVNQNRVGVTVFGAPGQGSVARLADCRGRKNVARAANFILDHAWAGRSGPAVTGGESGPGARFGEALTTIARMRVGKGVMVVISDFLVPDGYERGLRALAAAGGYDTYCLQVLSPAEIEPERSAQGGVTGDLRLTDVETGRASEVTVTAPLIKRYKERLESYCEGLAAFCRARELTYLLVRTDVSVEQLVFRTLRRAGMVG